MRVPTTTAAGPIDALPQDLVDLEFSQIVWTNLSGQVSCHGSQHGSARHSLRRAQRVRLLQRDSEVGAPQDDRENNRASDARQGGSLWFDKRWINSQMRRGNRIVDIGEPPGYPPSDFYNMELNQV